jgi:S1-C subfamily serine protease
MAVYFGEIPKIGLGILTRDMSPQEIQNLKTRSAIVVGFVRDSSPANKAGILPEDIITQVNGVVFDKVILDQAISSSAAIRLHIVRNGHPMDLEVNIPPDWRGLYRNLQQSPARR